METETYRMLYQRRLFPRVVLCVILLILAGMGVASDGLEAQSTDRASRVHLNYTVYHLQEALRSAEQSYTTYPLPGFDYHKLFAELHTVAGGVDVFLRPRPGEPGPAVPAQIDGRYLAEHLLREERALEEITDHTRHGDTTRKTVTPRAEEDDAGE